MPVSKKRKKGGGGQGKRQGSRNTAEKRGRMLPAETRHLSKADCPRWRYGDWDCVGRRLATGFPAGSTGDARHHASGRGQGRHSVLLRDG